MSKVQMSMLYFDRNYQEMQADGYHILINLGRFTSWILYPIMGMQENREHQLWSFFLYYLNCRKLFRLNIDLTRLYHTKNTLVTVLPRYENQRGYYKLRCL